MSIWHQILYWLGLHQDPGPRFFELSKDLHSTLSTLAEYEGQPEHELAEAVFASGLDYYYSRDAYWKIWKNLTPRERDVTALTCLGYTNRQMAARLGISVETIKTHVANTLRKFNLRSKTDLRVVLANWNFTSWLE